MTPAESAISVLVNFWDYSLPVNPVKMAENLNLSVYYDATLSVSGWYDADNQAIYVNQNEGIQRQRFSIAHEIGHAVMRHGSSPRTSVTYNKENYSPKEFQANEFAAELLIPREPLDFYINHKDIDFKELCEKFDVSSRAMKVRLTRLGYM